jgi:hypothetical protein
MQVMDSDMTTVMKLKLRLGDGQSDGVEDEKPWIYEVLQDAMTYNQGRIYSK